MLDLVRRPSLSKNNGVGSCKRAEEKDYVQASCGRHWKSLLSASQAVVPAKGQQNLDMHGSL